MKIKEGYVLRQIANTWVVLPLAEATVNFDGMLKLNDSGAMLWRALEQGGDIQTLTAVLTSEYEVSANQASADVEAFLQKLIQSGCVETE